MKTPEVSEENKYKMWSLHVEACESNGIEALSYVKFCEIQEMVFKQLVSMFGPS